MKKHQHLRNYKSGQNVVQGLRDPERERQVALSPVSEAVRQLVARIPTASREEAINIGLILSQLGHGDASLLSNENDPAVAETISKLREKAARQDAIERRFAIDGPKLINEIFENAESIKPKGEALDREIARGSEIYRQAREEAAAEKSVQHLTIAHRIASDPEENVDFLPIYDNIKQQGGGSVPVEIPTDISIGTFKFRYMSGIHKVPLIVADRYREILKGRAETEARMSVLRYGGDSPSVEYNQAERDMQKIDKQFNSSHQSVAIV